MNCTEMVFSKSRFSFTRGVVASIAAAPVATATNERTNGGGSSPSHSAAMAATKGFIANLVFGSSLGPPSPAPILTALSTLNQSAVGGSVESVLIVKACQDLSRCSAAARVFGYLGR